MRDHFYFFLCIALAGVLASGCGDEEHDHSAHAPTPVSMLDLSGKDYFQMQCAQCHGENGEGTDMGYIIQHPVPDYATWVIRNGRPKGSFGIAMPHYNESTLTDQQIEEMLRWLKSLEKPRTGEELYNVYCANCHGLDGRGGDSQVDVQHEWGSTHEIWEYVRYGAGGSLYEKRGDYMPKWNESEITEVDIALITDHLRVLHFQ